MSDNADLTPEFDPNEPRKIEQAVKVWLMWDHATSRWVVDPASMDGLPLDSPYSTSRPEFYDEGRPITGEDHAAYEAARVTDFPTGEQLIDLLREAAPRVWTAAEIAEDAAYAENERRKAAEPLAEWERELLGLGGES